MSKAFDEAVADGIVGGREHDRDGFGGFEDGGGFDRRAGQDHIRLER
jgi:hypothetical protein